MLSNTDKLFELLLQLKAGNRVIIGTTGFTFSKVIGYKLYKKDFIYYRYIVSSFNFCKILDYKGVNVRGDYFLV